MHTIISCIHIITVVLMGSLTILHHPIENELLFEEMYSNHKFEDNRTGIALGSTVSMSCAADNTDTPPVQILWIRNGRMVNANSNHFITNVTNLNSSLQIANFAHDDAGVYQCIFNTEIELITTRPFKLQTGEYIILLL